MVTGSRIKYFYETDMFGNKRPSRTRANVSTVLPRTRSHTGGRLPKLHQYIMSIIPFDREVRVLVCARACVFILLLNMAS